MQADECLALEGLGEDPDGLVDEFEYRLSRGWTHKQLARWAEKAYSLSKEKTLAIIGLIRNTWLAEDDPQTYATRKSELRARYNAVYRDSIAVGKLETAARVLDSIAKLDGLITPDINITLPKRMEGVVITARARERVGELLGRIQKASAIDTTATETAPVPVRTNGHTNHGTNGKRPAVIDHPANPRDDEET